MIRLEITSPPIGRDTEFHIHQVLMRGLEITSPPIGRDTLEENYEDYKVIVSKLPPHQ